MSDTGFEYAMPPDVRLEELPEQPPVPAPSAGTGVQPPSVCTSGRWSQTTCFSFGLKTKPTGRLPQGQPLPAPHFLEGASNPAGLVPAAPMREAPRLSAFHEGEQLRPVCAPVTATGDASSPLPRAADSDKSEHESRIRSVARSPRRAPSPGASQTILLWRPSSAAWGRRRDKPVQPGISSSHTVP